MNYDKFSKSYSVRNHKDILLNGPQKQDIPAGEENSGTTKKVEVDVNKVIEELHKGNSVVTFNASEKKEEVFNDKDFNKLIDAFLRTKGASYMGGVDTNGQRIPVYHHLVELINKVINLKLAAEENGEVITVSRMNELIEQAYNSVEAEKNGGQTQNSDKSSNTTMAATEKTAEAAQNTQGTSKTEEPSKTEETDSTGTPTLTFDNESDADKFWNDLKNSIKNNTDVYLWYSSGKGDDFSIGTYFKDPTSSNPSDECGKLAKVLDEYSKQIKEYVMAKYGLDEQFAQQLVDLAIKNAVYETLDKKPFDRQSDYEDTIIDVLRGSWNFKDLMTNVINQIDSIAKVKTPGNKEIKEVLSLSKEDIMKKYSLPEELAQIVLDFITEKANSKDADSVADLVKNYIDLCSNLDDIINPKLDNSVIMDPHVLYGYSSPDGEYDISNNWEFFSYLVQRMLGPAQEAEDILKKTSSQSLIDWFNNSEICNFIDNSIYAGSSELHGMPTNFGVFMLRIFTTTLAFPSMNDENKLQAENIPDLFWCPGYNKMVKNVFDKNGNGAIDELFEIMKDLFKDCRETAEYIVNNRAEYELRDALAQYSAKYNPADYFDTGLLDHANIPYTTEVVLHNDNRYDIIRFTFDGLDYEIVTYRKSEEEYRTVNDVSNKEIDQFIEDKYTNNAYVGDLLANSLYNLISCDTPYRLSQAFCDEDKLQDLFNAVRGNIDVSETLYSIVKCEHATADGMFDCIALVLKNLYKVNKNSSDEDILNALQNLCKDIGVYDEMDYRANNFEHVVSKTDWRGRPNFNECGDDISKLDSGYYYYDKATGTKFPNYTRFVEYMDERNGKIFGNFMKLLYKVPECKNTVKEVYLEETERRAHVIIRTSPAGTVTEPASVNFEPEDEEIKLLKAKAEKLYNHNFSTEGTIDEETIIAFCDDLMKTKYAYLVTQVCGRNYAEYIRNLYQTNWFYAPPSLLDAFALVMSIDDNFLKVLEDEEIASVTDPKNKNGYQNIITY